MLTETLYYKKRGLEENPKYIVDYIFSYSESESNA